MGASKFIELLDEEELLLRSSSYLDVQLEDLIPDLWDWDDGISSIGSISLTTGTATTAMTSVENVHTREDRWSLPSHTDKAPSSNRLSRLFGLGSSDPNSLHTADCQNPTPTFSKRQSRLLLGLVIPESGSAAAALESLNGGDNQPSSPRSDKSPSTDRMSRLVCGQSGLDGNVLATVENSQSKPEEKGSSSKRRSRLIFGRHPHERNASIPSAPGDESMKENLPPLGLEKPPPSKRLSKHMFGFAGFDSSPPAIPESASPGEEHLRVAIEKPAASKRRSMFMGSKSVSSIYGAPEQGRGNQPISTSEKPASFKRRSLMTFGHH